MWRADLRSYARAMKFVRSIVTVAVGAAGVLAATGSPAAAANLIADLRCDRGAGTYDCEVTLVRNPPPGKHVPPSFAVISWFVDGVREGSFNQRRFLVGSCAAGTIVEVRVKVTDPTGEPPNVSPDVRVARFRCLHIEPPGSVPAPVHGVRT
jgi:hypothetical protein